MTKGFEKPATIEQFLLSQTIPDEKQRLTQWVKHEIDRLNQELLGRADDLLDILWNNKHPLNYILKQISEGSVLMRTPLSEGINALLETPQTGTQLEKTREFILANVLWMASSIKHGRENRDLSQIDL